MLSLHTCGRRVSFTSRLKFNLETNECREFKLSVE